MENASKALLIAASVLLGVMIVSVGVVLFSSFGNSSKDIIAKLEQNKTDEFNSNFLKYYGREAEVTAHDVVTMANFAKQSNRQNGIENVNSYSQNTDYVQIKVDNESHFEKQSEIYYGNFIKNNMLIYDENDLDGDGELVDTKFFECKKIVTNEKTGRIIYVEIVTKKE